MKRSIICAISLLALPVFVSGCKDDVSTNNPDNIEVNVVKSNADFNRQDFNSTRLDSASFATIAASFSANYTEERRARLVNHMLTRVLALGEDVELMRTILTRAGCYTSGSYILPTYAERATFEGKEAWMVQFIWGLGSSSDLGHFKRVAFSVPDLDTLCFVTCR